MSARVLEIDGQFLYIPGCMIISFDDVNTHTTEVKIVRANQGVDLGKLNDIHEIYKEVTHDMIGVEEATQRLDSVCSYTQSWKLPAVSRAETYPQMNIRLLLYRTLRLRSQSSLVFFDLHGANSL